MKELSSILIKTAIQLVLEAINQAQASALQKRVSPFPVQEAADTPTAEISQQAVPKNIDWEELDDATILQQILDPGILEEIIEPSVQNPTDSTSPPPFISYVTFNRLGLTMQNLNKILDSDEDFEMHIIDCNSKDDTLNYIKSLQDKRIKSKTRLKVNRGPIYVLNYNLRKRKPNQYFFTIDSDVYIKTKNWLTRYMEIFEAFPEVGLLGTMRDNPYPRFLPPVIPQVKNDLSYLQLRNAGIDVIMDFIPGCLQGLRPELIDRIGYWNEECGYGDAELSPRIVHYTPFKVGFVTTVEIDMTQFIGCDKCQAQSLCTLNRSIKTCFMLAKQANSNESFAKKAKWKYLEIFQELADGKRTAYCTSLLDPASREGNLYHDAWALENFEYYLRRSN